MTSQVMAQLAQSLFGDQVRNRRVMPAWLAHPLIQQGGGGDRKRALSKSATTWAEHERERVNARRNRVRRAMTRRDGGLHAALERQRHRMLAVLVPAATAAAGKHIPRSTSALRMTVSAMQLSSLDTKLARSSESSSIIVALTDVFRALLLSPVQFTLVAGSGDDISVNIFPFGGGTSSSFSVPSSLLSAEERALIQYLGMTAAEWTDISQCTHFDGETLVASHIGNDAFDVALDRVRLVDAMREMMLYGGGEHILVRHVLEAALLATASDESVNQAGYFDSLTHMAWQTRLAPLPSPCNPAEIRNAWTLAQARERAARLRIRPAVDYEQYLTILRAQYTSTPEAIRQARKEALTSRHSIDDDDCTTTSVFA